MEKLYVIRNNETGKYVAIDRASGVYPYVVYIQFANTFYNKFVPYKYMKTMKAVWSLNELIMTTIETTWEDTQEKI